ncbi:hypothetical protein ACFU7T_12580 [Streptomyces sp. NPDC057555]|uniref:hypothetical protein n=1 Tax=Streptomyces sp. NPDC057555 TaxID=3346166 RepID=UPI00368E5292
MHAVEYEAKALGIDPEAMAERLSLVREDLTSENTTKVFARYGIDLYSISELRFI